MVDAMLQCEPRHQRPDFLKTRLHAQRLVTELLAAAPAALQE
jgi:hypothetical protein